MALPVTFTEVAMPAGDGNGSGLQVTFSTNADDQYQVSSIVAGGADYEVGDILSFRDRFSWGKPQDFNSSLDKGWHLLGGKGGKSAGYPQWIGDGAPGNTGASGGTATLSPQTVAVVVRPMATTTVAAVVLAGSAVVVLVPLLAIAMATAVVLVVLPSTQASVGVQATSKAGASDITELLTFSLPLMDFGYLPYFKSLVYLN